MEPYLSHFARPLANEQHAICRRLESEMVSARYRTSIFLSVLVPRAATKESSTGTELVDTQTLNTTRKLFTFALSSERYE
jgi:hypothetical protein